ncbi:MAG TPA: hypothetical protein VF399_09895 [bacterium]|jgi:hypothetical protein
MESIILPVASAAHRFDNSIPIIVDDIKNYADFEMTRCTYFIIESDIPSPGWILGLGRFKFPFYLLGLSGIISIPLGVENRFNTSETIQSLFDEIESNTNLYVTVNDIWLPNSLFKRNYHKRGCVYRITTELFIKAYEYRYNRIHKEQFIENCRELRGRFTYSDDETSSFTSWAQGIVKKAKNIYPKNRELALRWQEEKSKKSEDPNKLDMR